MTRTLDSSVSEGDRRLARTYLREFLPPVVASSIALPLATVMPRLQGDSSVRFLWGLLPTVPLLLMVRAFCRHVGRMDEWCRLVTFRGMAVGFAGCIVTAAAIGYLELAGVSVPASPWIVVGAGMGGWAIATLRYGV